MTVTVLVPSSLAREAEDKREATRKLGSVARAATIFRVDRLAVFPDPGKEGRWGDGFVRAVLAYAATPPYLRKEVWGRRDELEYVGVLPPLRVVSRTGSGDRPGSLRQGIVTEVGSDGRVRVNCGLQHPVSLLAPDRELEERARVTIRVSSRRPFRGRIVDEPPPGFRVETTSVDDALARDDAGLRVATSRLGERLTRDRLAALPPLAEGYTVAFGAPGRGLPEILDVDPQRVGGDDTDGATATGGEHGPSPRFDLWLDTVPDQGSETVRTEEAALATLAALNLE
jgi:predicted SPOUT superfamily RNA methylase MTH1